MPMTGEYLAVFHMDKQGPRYKAWYAASDEERQARDVEGLAALEAWMEAHRDDIVYVGGPLGPTKRVTDTGVISDTINQLTVFIVVRAPSHQAAAELLADNPHMTIFPCHAVEIMPILRGEEDGD